MTVAPFNLQTELTASQWRTLLLLALEFGIGLGVAYGLVWWVGL